MSSITDSPVAVMQRLDDVERALAELSPKLSYAAERRVILGEYIKRVKSAFIKDAEGKSAGEREAHVMRMLEQHGPMDGSTEPLMQASNLAEAAYARHKTEFEILDTRRSILQSSLKYHLREANPDGPSK